ncbi:MAG: hypothetical protein J7L32_05550 [Thermoplasmata archaeon]|nr:hypothetical protein [Thermoplasmata archaeon]RLF27688.1 MAG: hypothetical protein DRN01_01750 [Thermoplasmata archaeon]
MARYVASSGESLEDAVVILDAKNEIETTFAVHDFLEKRLGKLEKDWDIDDDTIIEKDNRYYDKMDIMLADGTKKTIYFDITSCWER